MQMWEDRPAEGRAKLARELRDSDSLVRERARRALVSLGRSAVPVLVEALSDSRDYARREAARALGKIHDASSAPALVKALEDELPGVRWLAGEGLVALGRDGLQPLLKALMLRADSVRLRQGAHHVTHALRAGGDDPLVSALTAALHAPDPITAIPVAAFNALKELEKS